MTLTRTEDQRLQQLQTTISALAEPRLRERAGISEDRYRELRAYVDRRTEESFSEAVAEAAQHAFTDSTPKILIDHRGFHEDPRKDFYKHQALNEYGGFAVEASSSERGRSRIAPAVTLASISERFNSLVTEEQWHIAKSLRKGRHSKQAAEALHAVKSAVRDLKTQGYTQAAIGQSLGVSAVRISRWSKP